MHNLSLQIATKLIRDILSVGYVVNIWDTETFALDAPSDSLQVILAHLGQTDQETVLVYTTAEGTNPPFTEIQLIYDPDDPTSVIADYYTAANKLTAGAEALAEAFETQPDDTHLIALIENAPVWAYHWAQNANGAGYYWEHKPVVDQETICWKAGPACWKPGHKCQSKRFDLQTNTPWTETLVEVKKSGTP